MPKPNLEIVTSRRPGELNEAQQRRLAITCKYIDKLLNSVEHALHSASSLSPFPRYVVDVTPAQTRVLEDHIRKIRSQLLRALDWQHMRPEPAEIPVTRAITTDLAFVDIAIEELRPSYMRGSGAVPDDAVEELNGVVHELRSLVLGMDRYVRQELGVNLESRLRKLETTGYDVALLRLIEELVTRHGLVEFRARIESLAARLEDNNLEVALFGRVSSGKSSLLNALLSTNVLPVGINPITAVPTKLFYGPTLRAAVAFGTGTEEIVTIEELSKLVTEQGNPGNLRNVVRAVVEVPSPRLKQGIVLVDTPGLGSLARRGAAETLAYLPSCDLALLLIDAGTALNDEDIGTLRLLYEGGIPAIVLLSKADLLASGDLHQATHYIQEQLRAELGLDMAVHAVSSLPDRSVLLDHFFERELLPRFEQARSLRNASIARKIGALRDAIAAALAAILEQTKRRGQEAPTDLHESEEQLRLITGEIGEQRSILSHAFFRLAEMPQAILSEAADSAVAWFADTKNSHLTSMQLSEWLHEAIWKAMARNLEETRAVCQRAIFTLQTVAQEMGRTDVPSPDEIESLLRDVPRFELAALPENINLAGWTILGQRFLRHKVRSSLEGSVGELLKQELHLYGQALSRWSEQFVSKIVLFVNSYASAYRVQLHRIAGTSSDTVDAPQLEKDLSLLKTWAPDERTEMRDMIVRGA
ncbi:dynamin family protein [Acidicapsa dinghuensis]|uniref:Dynamin family protein n=1 Tax=Acidicapsa dinghuensis TaxID=2218256 RepID=A0ABW1ECZ5_9BACT|nr:dynamin family protein [Acidicapsa dinghuensis]